MGVLPLKRLRSRSNENTRRAGFDAAAAAGASPLLLDSLVDPNAVTKALAAEAARGRRESRLEVVEDSETITPPLPTRCSGPAVAVRSRPLFSLPLFSLSSCALTAAHAAYSSVASSIGNNGFYVPSH